MGIYARWIFPRLIDWAMRNRDVAEYRRALIPLAYGRVLEVGIGSGLNLPFYTDDVEWIIGLDPSIELLRLAAGEVARLRPAVCLVRAPAETIPLADASMDTVVMTWMLCSIPDPMTALREMRRVLSPGGQLLFAEHGLAPEPRIARWQHRLDPLWVRLSCHLDRDVDDLIARAGFRITEMQTGYLGSGPKPMTFMYRGSARPTPGTAEANLDLSTVGMPSSRSSTEPSSRSTRS